MKNKKTNISEINEEIKEWEKEYSRKHNICYSEEIKIPKMDFSDLIIKWESRSNKNLEGSNYEILTNQSQKEKEFEEEKSKCLIFIILISIILLWKILCLISDFCKKDNIMS